MKRILAFLLALMVMIPAAVAEGTNATLYLRTAENEATVKRAVSMCAAGEWLYLMTETTLERWESGLSEPEIVSENVVNLAGYSAGEETMADIDKDKLAFNFLVSDGQTPYGVALYTGAVLKLLDDAGTVNPTAVATLKTDSIKIDQDGYLSFPEIKSAAIVGGNLYFVGMDYSKSENQNALYRFDLATGEGAAIDQPMIQSVTPYTEGKLLCKYYDPQNSWDEKTNTQRPMKLATYDLATGETQELLTLEGGEVYGVVYKPETDTIYYTFGAQVRAVTGLTMPSRVSAYLPERLWEDGGTCLTQDGCYAVATYNGVTVRGLDLPGIEKGALTIYGEYGTDGHRAFLSQHPEIAVTVGAKYYSKLEEFTSAMISGDDAVDVLRVSSRYTPLQRLIDKGYCMDLSAYPELVAIVDSMYPQYTDFLKKDGKLYGVPVGVNGSVSYYNQKLWEELGLSENDLPQTWMDLLDFVENWMYDYGEDHMDVNLIEGGISRETLLNQILYAYVASYAANGEELAFDTPLLRQLLDKLDQIDFTPFEQQYESTDEDSFWSNPSLFMMNYDYSYLTDRGDATRVLLPLTLDEGSEWMMPANVDVLIINPRTSRADEAALYVQTYASNPDSQSAAYTLFPDHNEPLKNPYYEESKRSMTESLEELKKKLETTAPEDEAELKESIANVEQYLADNENYAYSVTEESIHNYRQNIAPAMRAVGQTVLDTWDKDGKNDFYTLLSQYTQNAFTAEQFIREMDKRVRMMNLEGQ